MATCVLVHGAWQGREPEPVAASIKAASLTWTST